MPPAKVTRLPPVEALNPIAVVSPTTGRTLSYGTPSTSATIIAIEAREPPMSGWPSVTVTVPSSLTWQEALEFAAGVVPVTRSDAAALVGPELGLQMRMGAGGFERLLKADVGPGHPVRRLPAILGAVDLAHLRGSILSACASSSMQLSTPNEPIGAPGRDRRQPWAVAQHVIADGQRIREIVDRHPADAALLDGRAGKRAGLVFENALRRR